jgi:hypothetical protein
MFSDGFTTYFDSYPQTITALIAQSGPFGINSD